MVSNAELHKSIWDVTARLDAFDKIWHWTKTFEEIYNRLEQFSCDLVEEDTENLIEETEDQAVDELELKS